MFESLTLSELPQRECGVLRASSSTRPILWRIEENGRQAVVKDFSVNGFLFRNVIGRFLIWREEKAYRRLRGLKGVPIFYRVIDGLALVVEEIPGRSIEGLEKEERLQVDFFRELRFLVEDIHQRGLAHCDLKRAPNVMVGPHKRPVIVDWSSSISEREFRLFPLNLVYRRFISDDLNGITKLQLRHCPDSVSPEERKMLFQRSRAELFIRAVRDRLREWLQKIA